MSLQYSGGTYRNDLYIASGAKQTLLTNINTTLVAAGWTTANVFAFNNVTYTANPAAAATIVVSLTTYTFRAAVGVTANEVLIGADATTTFTNLINAINLGPGSGTTYGSATVLNANLRGASLRVIDPSSGNFRLEAKTNATPFGQQNLFGSSPLFGSGFAINFAANNNAGYIWTSPLVAATGQQQRVYGLDSAEGTGFLRFYQMDESERYPSAVFPIAFASGDNTTGVRLNATGFPNWRVIASSNQFLVYADGAGAPTGGGTALFCGVPFIYTFQRPWLITGATNATPIVITTSTAHGYITGDAVINRGVLGNTAANFTATVTVLSATTYSIPIAGNGAYTSGGVSAKSLNGRVAMAMILSSDDTVANMFPMNRSTVDASNAFQNINGSNYRGVSGGIGNASLVVLAPANMQNASAALQFQDGTFVLAEPHLLIGPVLSGKARWVGQMYDMFVSMDATALGTTATVDSRNWFCVGNFAGSTTIARCSIWMVVP